MICPLYKKTVIKLMYKTTKESHVPGKIFKKILDKRLVSYAEGNHIFYEEQAGNKIIFALSCTDTHHREKMQDVLYIY